MVHVKNHMYNNIMCHIAVSYYYYYYYYGSTYYVSCRAPQQASFPQKICSGAFEGQVSRVSSICLAPVWARALCAWGPGQAAP